ncbi:MAG TPA: branched-chain amino acid ABC transporter permease [Solirubrobacteraceae bacterium]|jgi:branched-chain amino acid transport system permease protein|nr:branched-chain amino acid ABC transporter permease [Solirubrobacteraceae bacterium]
MTLFTSEIINGLVLASFFALVAGGLALIFGVVGIVNFAHGDFVMIGGYFFYDFYVALHMPYALAIVVTIGATALLGSVIYWVLLRHLIERPWYAQLVATLALSILFENIAQAIWSPTPRSVLTPATLNPVFKISSVNVTLQEIYIVIGTAVCLLILWGLVSHTRWGKAMRALSQNREACFVTGINMNLVAVMAFAIGTGMCGLAACLVLPMQDVDPTVGLSFTTQAFVVVILGGMGSVKGATLAAIIVGLVDALAAGYISSAYTDGFGYVVMILILLVRPTGLFGARTQGAGAVAL